ncbi:response regulator [Ponticaulis sp.]|uniref:response regulator n=1 Tax=Ponticaulis sp. TaxID=2020902 RepID=UPI000B62494E|nr:response regulator [Ponticaulis sp.]MAI89141.1 hypothetical protein [Ponticaulis sp.]OUY01140.1 MAG: hypothetical protein CBB65_01485 [Hyphomonadaceae bacterium TMED5]|tara:strand:- start:128211 stop:128933 length:723 start_codon:yes stop_codon:yes gene_type:complete
MPSEENKASTIVGDYCVKLPDEMRSVTNLMERASKDQLDSLNALKALYAELHRMGGSALCMGYPFLGESMRELSNVLAEKIASTEQANGRFYVNIAQQMESLARLASHIRPEQSQFLQTAQRRDSATAENANAKPTTAKPEDFSLRRVAFADDDSTIRALMRNILSDLELEAFEVYENGEKLLLKAPLLKPDLIITDWLMAPVSGLDLVQTVRSGKSVCRRKPRLFFSRQSTLWTRLNWP